MCSVSMIMDYGQRDFWPNWTPPQPSPPPFVYPNPINPFPPIPPTITDEHLRAFLKLVEAAKEYDRKTAQPDCEDPVKIQVLERVLERLENIEKHLGISTENT